MSANEEKYRLVNDTERAIDRYRNIVFYFTFIAYANSHLSRKCYTNLKVSLLHLVTHYVVGSKGTPPQQNLLNIFVGTDP